MATTKKVTPGREGYKILFNQKEYEAITRSYVSKKLGEDHYQRLGQRLTASAWWKE